MKNFDKKVVKRAFVTQMSHLYVSILLDTLFTVGSIMFHF